MKPKFKRVGRPTNKADEIGKVMVSIRLCAVKGPGYAIGNITKSFTVADAKVSDVVKAIEMALFGESAQ